MVDGAWSRGGEGCREKSRRGRIRIGFAKAYRTAISVWSERAVGDIARS